MPASKDYYRILQVDPSAEWEVIESAYKRLARKYHPDANPSPDANERMKVINEAYEVLRDPTRRKEYDQTRGPTNEQARTEPKAPTGILCPKCNQLNALDEIYCQKCLHQLKQIRFCTNCGQKPLDDARFCLNCGQPLL